MNPEEHKRLSKMLSYVLRHHPETLGINLDEHGWAAVPDLLQAFNENGTPLDVAGLVEVVSTNAKQRFSFNEAGTHIRANQGHSIPVSLDLLPTVPPVYLFHGTAEANRELISEKGILKQQRQYVHLSADVSTAMQVGQRHGKPMVFVVDAAGLHETGHIFYQSVNGVWLTDHVPPGFIEEYSAS